MAFTIPHEAWQSAGGAEDDEGGGTYPCRADVVCDEATAMHTPIATLDKACLAAAKACELCPTVETASGVLRFWAMKVPDGELTGSVLLVGQGGGGKSGDGSYTLPTATPFRLGGVKVGDGLTVDNEGKLINMAKARGRNGAIQALVDQMEKAAIEPEKQTIFISHGNCYDEAKRLAELVHERFGCKSVINFVGPTIAAHSGQGTLALFFIGTER